MSFSDRIEAVRAEVRESHEQWRRLESEEQSAQFMALAKRHCPDDTSELAKILAGRPELGRFLPKRTGGSVHDHLHEAVSMHLYHAAVSTHLDVEADRARRPLIDYTVAVPVTDHPLSTRHPSVFSSLIHSAFRRHGQRHGKDHTDDYRLVMHPGNNRAVVKVNVREPDERAARIQAAAFVGKVLAAETTECGLTVLDDEANVTLPFERP